MGQAYSSLSLEERTQIGLLLTHKLSVRKMAEQLGRSPSTISRELRRNRHTRHGYVAAGAQQAGERRVQAKAGVRALKQGDRFMQNSQSIMRYLLGKHWGSQLFATIFAIIFGFAIVFLALVFGEANSRSVAVNLLICLVGTLFGWIVGIFFSPFDAKDKSRMEYLGKSVAAFASGYLLSTFQPVLKTYSDKPDQINWQYVGLFLSSFLLAAVVVFVSRSYSLAVTSSDSDTGKDTSASADPSAVGGV